MPARALACANKIGSRKGLRLIRCGGSGVGQQVSGPPVRCSGRRGRNFDARDLGAGGAGDRRRRSDSPPAIRPHARARQSRGDGTFPWCARRRDCISGWALAGRPPLDDNRLDAAAGEIQRQRQPHGGRRPRRAPVSPRFIARFIPVPYLLSSTTTIANVITSRRRHGARSAWTGVKDDAGAAARIGAVIVLVLAVTSGAFAQGASSSSVPLHPFHRLVRPAAAPTWWRAPCSRGWRNCSVSRW